MSTKGLKRRARAARMEAKYALFHKDYYQRHGFYLHNREDWFTLNIRKLRDRELSQRS
jgi:hypothetical protein